MQEENAYARKWNPDPGNATQSSPIGPEPKLHHPVTRPTTTSRDFPVGMVLGALPHTNLTDPVLRCAPVAENGRRPAYPLRFDRGFGYRRHPGWATPAFASGSAGERAAPLPDCSDQTRMPVITDSPRQPLVDRVPARMRRDSPPINTASRRTGWWSMPRLRREQVHGLGAGWHAGERRHLRPVDVQLLRPDEDLQVARQAHHDEPDEMKPDKDITTSLPTEVW